MEKIVKKIICFVVFFTQIQAQSQIGVDEQKETLCKGVKNFHYYSKSKVSASSSTVSKEAIGFRENEFHMHFYSEVNDLFSIYINGALYKKININTTTHLNNGVTTANVKAIKLVFPNNKDIFTLKIESVKYGCIETEARKEYPMLYLKFWNNSWYLDHNVVFELPNAYFMKNRKKIKYNRQNQKGIKLNRKVAF